jgi:hypothetical protein
MANVMPSEIVALCATIDPDATVASTVTSDWVDAGDYEAIMAVVYAGALGSNATVDAKIEQATDSSGSGAKDLTSSDITQLTEAGSDSDKQAIIQFRPDALDMDGLFRFVRLSITVATATSDVGGAVYGVLPRYKPASDSDLASVDEIVTV